MKPIITLKDVKHHPDMSEETYCYSATVLVDGEVFCKTLNRGQGGSDEPSPIAGTSTMADIYALDAAITKLYDKVEYRGLSLDETLETLCHDAVTRDNAAKRYDTLSKKVVLYIDKDESSKEVYSLSCKPTAANIKKATESLGPSATILNALPKDEGREIFVNRQVGEYIPDE